MKTEIEIKLETLAFESTIPFCYACYIEAPTGKCLSCGSDDLMRLLSGIGVEYGTEWVVKHILETELNPVDTDEAFENSMRECYPEATTIGFLKDYDTVLAIKELGPIMWEIAKSEWEANEESEEQFFSLDGGSTYYLFEDLEKLTT